MKRYLTTLCSALLVFSLQAQNSLKEINAIKKSKHYVYATATSSNSQEEAVQSAKDLLMLEVEQWLKDEKKGDLAGYVVKVKNSTSQIETQRGKLYKVFVYVAKKDVLPYYQDEEVETVKTLTPSAADTLTSVVESIPADTVVALKLTETEEQMLKIKTFDELNAYIKEQKANEKLADCGKYATWPKEANVYLFVYNPQAKVCAVIKAYGGELVNLETLQKDSIDNYKGCGAIWIKMNDETSK